MVGERGQGPSDILGWVREDTGLLEWTCGRLVYKAGGKADGVLEPTYRGAGQWEHGALFWLLWVQVSHRLRAAPKCE